MPDKYMSRPILALFTTGCIIATVLVGAALGRVAGASLYPETSIMSPPLQVGTPGVTPSPPTPPRTYRFTLLIEKEGPGQVNHNPWPGITDNKYSAGTTVYLEAIPAYGWEFSSWSGDVTGPSPKISFAMNSDKRLTAHFQASFASTVGLLNKSREGMNQLVKKNLT